MSDLFKSAATTAVKAPRRGYLWIIPLVLILIIAAFLLVIDWQQLLPAETVTVSRARLSSTTTVKKGKALFQAAGWVDPNPYLTWASSLISGTVIKIHAQDGDKVEKGQLLAELDAEAFVLEHKASEAKLKELEQQKEDYNLQQKTLLAELDELKAREATALAASNRMKHRYETFKASGAELIPNFDIQQAELALKESESKIVEIKSSRSVIMAKVDELKNQLLTAESGIKRQLVEIERNKLNIKRTKVYAPISGIIHDMHAREGRKQMLGSDNEHSTCVATIYDPTVFRVHVDVPLSEYSKVKLNQQVRVYLDVVDDVISGTVKIIYGKADYQKNTMAVHVELIGEYPSLRPAMLAQVEFISDETGNTDNNKTEQDSVFIQKSAIIDNAVWLVNEDNTVSRRTIVLGDKEQDDWVEVKSGINPGEKLILNPSMQLKEGSRVKIGALND